MAEVRIGSAAENDYAASLGWYAARSIDAAIGFEAEVSQALSDISANPDRWPCCDQRHRFYLLRRYPFQIIYRVEPTTDVLVVAFAHTSRQPEDWSKRG